MIEQLLKMASRHLMYTVVRRSDYALRETIVFKSPRKVDVEEYVARFRQIGNNHYHDKSCYSYYIQTVWDF